MKRVTLLAPALAAAVFAANLGGASPAPPACPVIDSRDWSAWIDAQPGPDAARRLHVRGEVDLPTPGFQAVWRLGPADRRRIPSQILDLTFQPPEGMVIQVVSSERLAFETHALYPGYASIKIRCGDLLIAEIAPVEIVH